VSADGQPTRAQSGAAATSRPEYGNWVSTRFVVVPAIAAAVLVGLAVGLHVVHELQRELAEHPALDIRETTEMGLALLDFITGYRTVVIVESIQTGKASPGFLHQLDASALHELTGRTPHFVGVSETLALGQKLGLAMPTLVRIFAIEVEDPFTLGTELTPALQAALPGIVQRIADSLLTLI